MKPKFSPEQWIVFAIDDYIGIGKIVGGSFYEDAWHYDLDMGQEKTQRVDEDQITFRFANDAWRHIKSSGDQSASVGKSIDYDLS